MTATRPPFPAPGTTYGPDAASLDELRAVLRAHDGRGEWRVIYDDGCEQPNSERGWEELVWSGETWTLVRDTAKPEPGPEPARTVTVSLGWTFWFSTDAKYIRLYLSPQEAELARGDVAGVGVPCGPVVEVRAALPLPVEPAVVVGEVADADR